MSTLLGRSLISHVVPVVLTVLLFGALIATALQAELIAPGGTVATPTPVPTPILGNPIPGAPAPTPAPAHTLEETTSTLQTWLIGGVLLALLVGVNLASISAYYLERPLAHVTRAVAKLSKGEKLTTLDESGPKEIADLVNEFNQLTERLAAVESSREQLLTNVVHELGRPLGAMKVAVRALRDGAMEDTDFRDDLLLGVEEEIQRLNRLLDNLAQLGGSVLHTFEIHPRPLDLAEWLPAVVALWRPATEAKSLHWQSTIPNDLPIITADPDRLGQVIGNLISNAVRYTQEGGTVAVTARHTDTHFELQVRDSGIGIAPDEQAKIFIPFYRSRSHTRFPQGMGLGLTIAKEIVEAHGGTLSLASQTEEGSTFTLSIPYSKIVVED